MQFERMTTNERAAQVNRAVEQTLNGMVRRLDRTAAWTHLGGRKAQYDDHNFEFVGGACDTLRKKHYDKSLRLLWKAEKHAPYLGFRDSNDLESSLAALAEKGLDEDEKAIRAQISSQEYRDFLDREYTYRQKLAIVNILAAIGHGEAYAWLVSADLLSEVKSTGARAALTMQVLEEAKHFVVLRELLMAFQVPIRRQSAWEYIWLERVYKAEGVEKMFGMNVLVEGVALALFGQMRALPGLEILRLFHQDEARHTALPANYFREFPLSLWQKHSPQARLQRLRMLLPALAIVPQLEEDLAELGIDALEFGGTILRKVAHLAEKSGFALPLPSSVLLPLLNVVFNAYGAVTHEAYHYQNFMGTRRGDALH